MVKGICNDAFRKGIKNGRFFALKAMCSGRLPEESSVRRP